jgi:hypothetical protein
MSSWSPAACRRSGRRISDPFKAGPFLLLQGELLPGVLAGEVRSFHEGLPAFPIRPLLHKTSMARCETKRRAPSFNPCCSTIPGGGAVRRHPRGGANRHSRRIAPLFPPVQVTFYRPTARTCRKRSLEGAVFVGKHTPKPTRTPSPPQGACCSPPPFSSPTSVYGPHPP